MTQYDPNDPRPAAPVYTETTETVVVRESNTGWWIAGILGGVVLIAVLWILFARGQTPQSDAALLEAQVDAATAQAQADQAADRSRRHRPASTSHAPIWPARRPRPAAPTPRPVRPKPAPRRRS
jgi:hypothetical protein